MKNLIFGILLCPLLFCCQESDVAEQGAAGGLQKISNLTEAQIQELRDAGAEIIVQEPDYIVVRTTNMTGALAFSASGIEEKDLLQRLVHIHVPGVDFWQVDGDTAIARAFDIYINDLRAAGLSVRIVAQDASKWAEGIK